MAPGPDKSILARLRAFCNWLKDWKTEARFATCFVGIGAVVFLLPLFLATLVK
jgi:hypothetical protein